MQEEEDGPYNAASDNHPHPLCPLRNAPGGIFLSCGKPIFCKLYQYLLSAKLTGKF